MKLLELDSVSTPTKAEPSISLGGLPKRILLVASAVASFHLAFIFPSLAGLILVYAFSLIRLAELQPATGFRAGFIVGMLVVSPHLYWFWKIFGFPALFLWTILSLFTGIFVLIIAHWRARFGSLPLLLPPILWCGIEFFRGELYPLRFTWLSAAHVFPPSLIPTALFGLYGCGLLIFLAAAAIAKLPFRRQIPSLITASAALSLLSVASPSQPQPPHAGTLRVAGIQLEFPPDLAIPGYLDHVIAQHPETDLLVLSEYTFDGPVPERVRRWCDQNNRYLVAGGKDPLDGDNFYNTSFVVGPGGEIVFKQSKSVPIQFFHDGTPAPSRQVWKSPWGRLAIPVCYDLSYRRVIDDFIEGGAQAIIVPFMDVEEWGEYQHRLHARNSALRAAEYQLPIFRLGSSGISQHIDASGKILAQSSFPGQEEIFAATLHIPDAPNLPLDHWIAPACSAATMLVAFGLFILNRRRSILQHP